MLKCKMLVICYTRARARAPHTHTHTHKMKCTNKLNTM